MSSNAEPIELYNAYMDSLKTINIETALSKENNLTKLCIGSTCLSEKDLTTLGKNIESFETLITPGFMSISRSVDFDSYGMDNTETGMTREKCIEVGEKYGFEYVGHRNAKHGMAKYKNTCFRYTFEDFNKEYHQTSLHNWQTNGGNPDDKVHSTIRLKRSHLLNNPRYHAELPYCEYKEQGRHKIKCGSNEVAEWGIGPEGRQQSHRNCTHATSNGARGMCFMSLTQHDQTTFYNPTQLTFTSTPSFPNSSFTTFAWPSQK